MKKNKTRKVVMSDELEYGPKQNQEKYNQGENSCWEIS